MRVGLVPLALEEFLRGLGKVKKHLPSGSKVANYRVFRVSILGIVIMVLGRYLIVEYLDP